MRTPRVAIVHDWLYGGGAELVVEQLHKMFPEAPIYTSYCSDEWRARLDNKVVTGYLQNKPFSSLRKLLPVLRQHWFKNLDLSQFDLIISSSGNGEAKFVKRRPGATHICYCHTPTHFYWSKYNEYLRSPSFRPKWLARLGLRLLVKPLRRRDYKAAQAVDYFIANSTHIQNDISTYYKRESIVIHPPVDVDKFKTTNDQRQTINNQRFITWGRHIPYKRMELAVAACTKLNLPLTIIGTGPETSKLKKIAGPTVTFTGWVENDEVPKLARKASAFIFTAEEDFGIAPIEAMAAGLPVIAYKAGGALDYVKEGTTGTFFTEQTMESLIASLKKFKAESYKPTTIAKSAEEFSSAKFREHLTKFVRSIEK